MEIIIVPKYNINDKIWFMHNNLIMHGKIYKIFYAGSCRTLNCDSIKPDNTDFDYDIELRIDGCQQIVNMAEDKLFASKEELIKYLDDNINKNFNDNEKLCF